MAHEFCGPGYSAIVIHNFESESAPVLNADVHVTIRHGDRYSGVVVSLEYVMSNLQSCNNSYFWAHGMIITRDFSKDCIERAIDSLVTSGEISVAFVRQVDSVD